jgi:hypothetical protein
VDGYRHYPGKRNIEVWIKLIHVCQRWRTVVFQSPLRLNLRLVCTPLTHTRDILDAWPPLPLIIDDHVDLHNKAFMKDNIIAALEHNDRVCRIHLKFMHLVLQYFTNSAGILKPFPELTYLSLNIFADDQEPKLPDSELTYLSLSHFIRYADEDQEPKLPDSFLGGSAPRLQSLSLIRVSFPALPKLLLSTTHLVRLELTSIPRSGYISPETMVTSLSALTSLESLELRFAYPQRRPSLETRRPPLLPLTRSILPSLTEIEFKGVSEYLEEILARIDAPRLHWLYVTFFNQFIFDTPQLSQFISRSPTLRALEKGRIESSVWDITFRFQSQTSDVLLTIQILCTVSEWQLSSLEQVCTSLLPPVSMLEDLYISEDRRYIKSLHWPDDVENSLWLELLHSFSAVKNLYISEKFVPRIAPTLQELVGGRTMQVLPVLGNIFLGGFQPSRPLQEGIEKFVAARLLISHPVAVSRWNRGSE